MLLLFTTLPTKLKVPLGVRPSVPAFTVVVPFMFMVAPVKNVKVPVPAMVKLLMLMAAVLFPPAMVTLLVVVEVKVAPEPAVKVTPLLKVTPPPMLMSFPFPNRVWLVFRVRVLFIVIFSPRLKVVLTAPALAVTARL